jgi:hypothetical protein
LSSVIACAPPPKHLAKRVAARVTRLSPSPRSAAAKGPVTRKLSDVGGRDA